MQRIAGRDFDIRVGDLEMPVEKATLDISDNIKVSSSGGVPDGWIAGNVEASGNLELKPTAIAILTEAAKNAGSFRELPTFDMLFYAKTSEEDELKVEAFGCKVRIEKLLDADRNSDTESITSLKFDITSRDFVRINGVPYLSKAETERL